MDPFSLEGVRVSTTMVDVIQRGESLAIFEKGLIIHFQQISRAAALHTACARRKCLNGSSDELESNLRGMEKCPTFESCT